MNCPDCHNDLKVSSLKGINIHECLTCKGKWFERNQLMLVKNKADEGLRWIDFDPFGKDAERLSIASEGKLCPKCVRRMQALTYSKSQVVIAKCQTCEGVWLSHGELAKIIRYLEKTIHSDSVKGLAQKTFKEFIKIFTIHQGLISEVKDFLAVLSILKIRIAVEHPKLAQAWDNIESISPIK